MTDQMFQIRQLADELQPPESGKHSIVLLDDAQYKSCLVRLCCWKWSD